MSEFSTNEQIFYKILKHQNTEIKGRCFPQKHTTPVIFVEKLSNLVEKVLTIF